MNEEQKQAVRDAVASALGHAYDCQRVWSAWDVGTMSSNDFSLVAEDDERLNDIPDAALAAMPAPFQARVQPWMMACFGAEIAADAQERNHRFLERRWNWSRRVAPRPARRTSWWTTSMGGRSGASIRKWAA